MMPLLEPLPRPRRRRTAPRFGMVLLGILCAAVALAPATLWPWVVGELGCAGVLVWSGLVLEPPRGLALAGTIAALVSSAAHILVHVAAHGRAVDPWLAAYALALCLCLVQIARIARWPARDYGLILLGR
jgi:hypothetical protein